MHLNPNPLSVIQVYFKKNYAQTFTKDNCNNEPQSNITRIKDFAILKLILKHIFLRLIREAFIFINEI